MRDSTASIRSNPSHHIQCISGSSSPKPVELSDAERSAIESEWSEAEADAVAGLYSTNILEGLKLDPGMVNEVLKMLVMLNTGLQTRHCTCKPKYLLHGVAV